MDLFDAEWYLEQNPDVKEAVRNGVWASAYDHFEGSGRAEGRAPCDPALAQVLQRAEGSPLALDELLVSADGVCLLVGWVDDRADAINEFAMLPYGGGQIDVKPHICRFRRPDVSQVKQVRADSFDFGVWASVEGLLPVPWLETRTRIRFASNRVAEFQLPATLISPVDLRDRILGLLALPRAHATKSDCVDKGLISASGGAHPRRPESSPRTGAVAIRQARG